MRALFLLLTASATIASGSAALAAPKLIPNQYICTFADSVARGSVRAEANRAANPALGQLLHVYETAIKGFAVRMPIEPGGQSQIAKLKKNNPNITACEQDQVMGLAYQGKPGGGSQPAEAPDWGVNRVGGAAGANSFGNRTAWVIDTGVDLDHPDLNVIASRSVSFVRDSSPDDFNGHGSHVAGTIAARDNAIGVIGVSPDAPVVSIRVLDRSGSGSNSGVIAGVNHVAGNAAAGDVANMSLGGGISTALDTAVVNAAAKGIRFVLAAGNSGVDANTTSPARANGANIYTVSAFAIGDNWASFSNFGAGVDFGEPGVNIRSTYKSGGYATLSGTSMAAPHLAGILMTGSAIGNGGTVNNDPDGTPDKIGIR